METKPRRPADCDLDYGGAFEMNAKGPATRLCHGDTVMDNRCRCWAMARCGSAVGLPARRSRRALPASMRTGAGFRWRGRSRRCFESSLDEIGMWIFRRFAGQTLASIAPIIHLLFDTLGPDLNDVKIFVSYTSSDRRWAHWIAWQLQEGGHQPFVHEWEIGAGQNIPRWMEERLDEADHLIGVFSEAYCNAVHSRSERWAACWDDPEGRTGFLIPIEVNRVTKWPRLIKPLNRLSLVGLNESKAQARLTAFLEPRRPPAQKPEFPGAEESYSASFTDNSEPLGSLSPGFPDAASITGQITGIEVSNLPPVETKSVRCIEDHEPKPQIFGRTDEIEAIVNAALDGKTVLVAGGPGIGKTAVTIAAFYDSRLVKQFGQGVSSRHSNLRQSPEQFLRSWSKYLDYPPPVTKDLYYVFLS